MNPILPTKFYNENEVQLYYSPYLTQILKCPFSARFRTDGIFYSKKYNIKILAEFKVHGDLKFDNVLFIRCIIQILCYIKKIEDSGEMLPNIIFIANDKHFVLFDSKLLNNYMKYVDSGMGPRDMFDSPPKILKNILLKDSNLNIHKYDITHTSVLKNIIGNFRNKSIGLKMTINNNNITRIFEDFLTSNVLNQKLSENQKVALFASIIFKECNDIVGKPNHIVTPYSEIPLVKINRNNYDTFLLSIKAINKPSSKNEIISQADRLIEEVSRRLHGEFYTPKIWVDEAHRMVEKQFGLDWKEKYVVWDPACGTGNLTRDYQFKELYCSTLYQSDIDIMNQRDYRGIKFQYDFLNDDVYPEGLGDVLAVNILEKYAPGLSKALEEKRKIIILFNPPYGSSGELRKVKDKKIKGGIAKNLINSLMLKDNMARASLQLYAQFLYRIILLSEKNKNISLCVFIPPAILATSSFKNFRKKFFKNFKFSHGIIFNAGYFSNVKNAWPISLIIMKPGKNNKNNFNFKLKDINKKLDITSIGEKQIYNSDNSKNAATWIRQEIKGIKFIDAPRLRNAIEVANDGRNGKMTTNAIGFIYYSGNVVYESALRVSIFSTTSSVEYNGFPIIPENFYKIISIFAARKSTILTWYNTSDEYLKPNTKHPDYFQWNIDSLIYSLFNGASSQSSLRNIVYKNETQNIENQFFWLPNDIMKQLADDNGFDELYQDSIVFNKERFVYQELQKVTPQLSPDGIDVLNKANELVVKSFPERKRLHNLHPEWHLNAWDAGWYQIKKVLNDCMKDDLKEFNILYKKFENRMREGVYKFGFLK